jgi:hypothetical protein
VHNGRTADIFIGAVHLHEQPDIGWGVLTGKGDGRGTVAFGQRHRGQPVLIPARYQPSDLGAAVATGAAQVRQDHPALAFAALTVLKALQDTADVLVALAIAVCDNSRACKADLGGCVQKLLQLRNRAQLCLVHVDHHPCDDQADSSSVSNLPVQAHTSLDKAGTCYKAANWINIGQTTGRSKKSKSHQQLIAVKDIWMYPLRKNFAAVLCH